MNIRQLISKHNYAAYFMAAFFVSAGMIELQAQPPTKPSAPVPVIATNIPQFVSIGDKPAIVYDAPSVKAQKIFILARQQPLEMLVKLDKWIKIRDADNTLGWVESGAIDNRRRGQVTAPIADIHSEPNSASSLVFEAQRMVILDITGAAMDGWLPVRHRDGQAGFVRKSQVWGE